MTDTKETGIIHEAIDKIRNAQNPGLIEQIEQHINDALGELQSSCGATKAEAVGMFHPAVVSSDGENMIHASAILDKLK
jgi:hypothetical protein